MKEYKKRKCSNCKKIFSYPTIYANSDQAFKECSECLGDNYDPEDDIFDEVLSK